MPRVTSGGIEPEFRVEQGADRDERQCVESDQGYLLSEFVDRGVLGGEHRDPELAVDVVTSRR